MLCKILQCGDAVKIVQCGDAVKIVQCSDAVKIVQCSDAVSHYRPRCKEMLKKTHTSKFEIHVNNILNSLPISQANRNDKLLTTV
jgi:hypothetical protein